MSYQHPFPESTVTAEWGDTADRPNAHRGRDYAPGGPPAPSIVTGKVVRSEWHAGLGNIVVIRNDVDGYFIGYSHLAERWVSPGTRVGPGTMIGVVGNTGTLSRGRHLHFTVSATSDHPASGSTIDPRRYINSGSSVVGGGGSAEGISSDTQKKMQQLLTNLKLYTGQVDGAWGQMSWQAIQAFLNTQSDDEGVLYSGPADGDPGINTIKGLQRLARRGGYGGPIDGAFGVNGDAALNSWLSSQLAAVTPPAGDYGDPIPAATQKAFQELLVREKLYTGLVDGAWGELSWKAIQEYMNRTPGKDGLPVYTGPADGDPGQFTYEGLQKLAQMAGYTGPIDGVFGPKSNEGLSNYIASKLAGSGGIPPVVPPQVPGIPVLPNTQIFGIDASRYQLTLDIPAFYAGGGKFTIFKCGGSNSGNAYTDAMYNQFVQTARAIPGALIGHYWFNGKANGQTPKTAAGEFWSRMKLAEGDLIVLDIEAEQASGTVAYTPGEAREFLEELQRLSENPDLKIGLYMSSSVERSGDWSWFRANGHFLWAAAYNSNDGTMAGGGPNLMDGHDDWVDDEWGIWQYASTIGRVPGYGGDIDMNVAKADTWTKYGYKKKSEPQPEEPDWKKLFQDLYSAEKNVLADFAEYAVLA